MPMTREEWEKSISVWFCVSPEGQYVLGTGTSHHELAIKNEEVAVILKSPQPHGDKCGWYYTMSKMEGSA